MQYALIFASKEEFDEAVVTLSGSGRAAKTTLASTQSALVEKLEAALASAPLNAQKATVLRTWIAAPEGEWVPYSAVVKAFVDSGITASDVQATNRASAAIRDLSAQVSQTLSRNDLAGFDKAIEALASRSRSSGTFSYRLTDAGRTATERFLSKVGAA